MSENWPRNKSDHVSNWRDKKQTKDIESKFRDGKYNRDNNFSTNNRNPRRDRDRRYYQNKNYMPPQSKPVKQEFRLSEDEFPGLSEIKTEDSNTSTGNYLNKCMKIKEEYEKRNLINVKDPKYWDRHKWIGPTFMKSKKPSEKWQKYLTNATAAENNVNTVLIPSSPIYYSRDNENWFPSWKETFTEEEWSNMENQEFQENVNRVMNDLAAKHDRELTEAYQLYYETGEKNICLEVHLEHLEYEKYVQNLEEEWRKQEEEDQQLEEDGYSSEMSE